MKNYQIVTLPGDGIGPEVTNEACRVLEAAADRFGFSLSFTPALIGGAAIDATGTSLPQESINLCMQADAVLLGAVGGPKWDGLPGGERPERGLLGIREELKLFANLRPAIVYEALRDASPLKASLLEGGLDLLIVRELTGGIYFGERGREEIDGIPGAYDTERYNVAEIERIGRVAFEAAQKRDKRLCSVDKANVLESSRLWRETMNWLSDEYPDVTLSHLYVDNAAMQLVRDPRQFDVIVTSNIFGDILSDEASQITGSIGMLPSASLGSGKLGLYEPVHGSAPDIAGIGKANPMAAILSAAMLLRYSLAQAEAADAIEAAVRQVLDAGKRSADLAAPGAPYLSTREVGDAVLEAFRSI